MFFKCLGVTAAALWFVTPLTLGQGFIVDQASGTIDEIVTTTTQIPSNLIAQSFTPSFSAVGFVQFSTYISAASSGETVVVNLREGAYNGPIVSSTTPLVLANRFTQISTFYFPDNIAITANQPYFFEPVLQSTGVLNVGYKFPSSYPGGEAWNNGLPSGDTSDYWFREGIVVPEPGTVWLLLFGSAVFIWRWRAGNNSRL